MPILNLQRSLVELGRIRIGIQETKNGRSRPAKLETFRFTTPSRDRADAVARIFGGEVRPWSPDGARQEFEVITPVKEIPVVIPAGPTVLSQWYEMWSGGGCQRRCDGVTNILADAPCQCPADPAERQTLAAQGRACKPTTRVNVILRDLPGIGVWRLESHGFYAATELAGTAEMLATASAFGKPLPATLRLEQRSAKRDGQTRRYSVPVLDIGATPSEILSGDLSRATAEIEAAPVFGDEQPETAEIEPSIRDAVLNAATVEDLRRLWQFAADELGEPVADRNGVETTLGDLFEQRRKEIAS